MTNSSQLSELDYETNDYSHQGETSSDKGIEINVRPLSKVHSLNVIQTAAENSKEDDIIYMASNTHFRKIRKAHSQYDLRSPSIFSRGPPMFNRSISQISNHGHSPTNKADKLKMTRRYFATVIGISYAIFLVIFGAVLFLKDAIKTDNPDEKQSSIAEIFCIYMILVSFSYFLFLYIDIRLHVLNVKKALKDRERRRQIFEENLAKLKKKFDGPVELIDEPESSNVSTIDRNLSFVNLPSITPISHRYCFLSGRHGEFFYLKLGAGFFVLGLLVESILQISYQVINLTDDDEDLGLICTSKSALILDILFPLYSIFVLFFIYKYINVIINEYREISRFFLMHAIGTSLAFWIFSIVRETSDAIMLSNDYNKDKEDDDSKFIPSIIKEHCAGKTNMNYIRRNFSPYLYPFAIEFSILIVGIWYTIWTHISNCPRKLSGLQTDTGHDNETIIPGNDVEIKQGTSDEQSERELRDEHDEHVNAYKSHSFIYADCHATHRGLFVGMVLVVVTIVFIILFFVIVTMNPENVYAANAINSIFEGTVLSIMAVAVILAYIQTSKLDINTHPISNLDDVLLFIAVPAFFMETILSMVSAVTTNISTEENDYDSVISKVSDICNALAQIIQVLLQTPFIIDGMRRCTNSRSLRKNKPGRELIMFLTIANVSLWIFYTFSMKTGYRGDMRYNYYGYTTWTILNHISQPLIMFYRFHASVCLVDIWRHSYEPAPPNSHHNH